MLLAQWLSRALVLFLSTSNNHLFVDVTPDWRFFAFVAVIAVLACLLFGLSPALRATGTSPVTTMQAGGRSTTDSEERFTVRRGLVVVQVALSIVLIVGSLLFGRSLRNLSLVVRLPREWDLAINVDPPPGIPEGGASADLRQVMSARRGGMQSAAEAFIVPMSSSGTEPEPGDRRHQEGQQRQLNRVGGDCYTMGTPIRRTRRPRRSPWCDGSRAGQRTPSGSISVAPIRSQTFQIDAAGTAVAALSDRRRGRGTKCTDLREEFTPIAYFAAAQVRGFLDLVVRSDLPPSSITRPDQSDSRSPRVDRGLRHHQHVNARLAVTGRLMASLSGFRRPRCSSLPSGSTA